MDSGTGIGGLNASSEEFVESNTTTSRCGCGANATKIVSATQCVLDGSSDHFPGRHMKWVREHEEESSRKQN